MLNFLKKSNCSKIYSPVIGNSILLEDVNDPVFSEKMMGDGIAFQFEGDTIYSPCDGKIIMVAFTKHAIGIDMNGVEILIHVGLETVNLGGKGLKSLVKVNNKVKRGQPLIKIDRSIMKENEVDMTTMMIVTSQNSKISISNSGIVDLDSEVIKIL